MAESDGREWRPFRIAAIACAVIAVALASFGVFDLGGKMAERAVTDGGSVVFSVFAMVTCLRAARRRAPGRLPWWLLGAVAACYLVGNIIFFYYHVLVPERQTFPGPADIFFVALVPFAVAAMLFLPSRTLTSAARARAIADGLVVGASTFFISWMLVVEPLLDQLGETTWIYLAVYLYYPLTDIMIISIASVLAVRAAGRERVPMLLVAAAFASIACGDTGIGYLALEGKEAGGSGLDLGWSFGYMLLGLAGLTPGWTTASDDRADPRALVRELLPYIPVGAVLVLVARKPSLLDDDVLVGVLVATVVLLVLRHLLTLADNVRLTGGLEQMVRNRTLELEQLTRRHTSILDGAADGIIGLDESGLMTFANPAAAALLGHAPDALVGRCFREVTQPRDADGEPVPADLDPVASALADGKVHVLTDGTCRRADGTEFSVELSVAPIHGPDEVTGAVLMFRDVTEQRAVDRMKDEFVSVVSHELRTPLTSLRGALGLLQGGLLQQAPPQAQRMVHIAVESTDRLIRLINDILDVERIAAGKLALQRQAWPAADLVDRAVGEMRGLATEAGVTLEVGAVGGVVDADADRIVQTMVNLLSNATKFSPAGGVVRITAVEQGRDVLFSVSDQGAGIPQAYLESIFGRFAQVDASDSRAKEGTGLGLAICRGIVQQHGGRIWVRSEPGEGATFCFTLPVVNVAVHPSPEDDPRVHTVLVCEDDPVTRTIISDVLCSHGYRVVGAASGEEALTLARRETPSAVLMDLNVPDLDGWSTITALSSDERTRNVPIVIVSVIEPKDPPVDVEAWLSKPLDVTGLLNALGTAIADGSARPCVLIVEDDPTLAQVLAALFAESGVVAVQANSARDALRLSHEAAPDLLLLDLLLPDSDGFALVDLLREDPRLCRVPLVVYSALELDDADKQRLRLGPTEFFTKTKTNPKEVQRHVLELLDAVVAAGSR